MGRDLLVYKGCHNSLKYSFQSILSSMLLSSCIASSLVEILYSGKHLWMVTTNTEASNRLHKKFLMVG